MALGEGQLDDAAALARIALDTAQRRGHYEQACEALEVLGQRERQRDLAAAEEAFTAALVWPISTISASGVSGSCMSWAPST